MDPFLEVMDCYLSRYHYRIMKGPLTVEEQQCFAVVKSLKDEGVVYRVSKELMGPSGAFKVVLERVGPCALVEVAVDATKETLERVFEFLDHHIVTPLRPIQKPIRGQFKDLVDEWDYNYFQNRLLVCGDEKQNMNLQLVVRCAHDLQLPDLKLFSCAALGSLIMPKKTEDEILDLFGARDKVKPEHWEKLYQRHPFMRPRGGEGT